MKINWINIFNEYRVSYITEGNHVKQGNVNINCPFCDFDNKFFMGVDVSSDRVRYGCWYDSEHRGTSPERLLAAILNVSKKRAREILGLDSEYEDEDAFKDALARLTKKSKGKQSTVLEVSRSLEFYDDFKKIKEDDIFYNYLSTSRKFFDDVPELCSYYNLKKCSVFTEDSSKNFYKRVIIPFYFNNKLVSWTGRHIGDSTLRYKDLSKAESVMEPKNILFNHDNAAPGGEVLFLLEGQFDVLKMDFYGKDFGFRAVGMNTRTLSASQTSFLYDLSAKFNKIIIMLDTQKKLDVVHSIKLTDQLSFIKNTKFLPVPYGYKDCGAMPKGRILSFIKNFKSEGNIS